MTSPTAPHAVPAKKPGARQYHTILNDSARCQCHWTNEFRPAVSRVVVSRGASCGMLLPLRQRPPMRPSLYMNPHMMTVLITHTM